MMRWLYHTGIFCYGFGIWIAGFFNQKARQWVKGRKNIFREIQQSIEKSADKLCNGTVWFHCASLGEFEQGRPVIEGFRTRYPDYRIFLTFFSPSGYEIRKHYPGADLIFYLPLDTPGNAQKLINLIQPKLVFFIKYEYWFNYLNKLHQKAIPVFIASAVFRPEQHFFSWYGGWFRHQLRQLSWIFLQNSESKQLLESIGIKCFTITGDTRFDRVIEVSRQPKAFPAVKKFCGKASVIIGGSTWPEDEALLISMIRKRKRNVKFIIAPHEVHAERLRSLIDHLGQPVIRFSELTISNANSARILILDTIGILANVYQYGYLALIGGGFGAGIHNILEAAAFGNPVFFGPNFTRFNEAKELMEYGGAFCVTTQDEFTTLVLDFLKDPERRERLSASCRNYIESRQGATQRILQGICHLGFIASPEKY